MSRKKRDKKPINDDEPFDAIQLVQDGDGTYRAAFYVAAMRHAGKTDWLAFPLEHFEFNQKRCRNEGKTCPLTDKAITLLREAMGMPQIN